MLPLMEILKDFHNIYLNNQGVFLIREQHYYKFKFFSPLIVDFR